MTTLVALQGDGWSVIGCDSRASDEHGRLTEMATHKIIDNKGVLIAGSGASRGSNILQFGWNPPKPRSAQDLDVFMTKTFIPAMREIFVKSGYDMKEDGDSAAHDSQFIVSIKGVIYPIYGDYSWDREERGIYYAGSGSDIALGALEALNYKRVTTPEAAEKVLRKAIEIAIRHDVYSGGEIRTHIQKS